MFKSFKMPNAILIVLMVMVFVALLTYVIPAGQYQTITNGAGVKVLDPNSFKFLPNTPVTVLQFMESIYKGMAGNAPLIMFLFLMGGYMTIIIETKAIDSFVCYLGTKFGDKAMLLIPAIVIIMSILGMSGAMVNPVVAMIPIGLVICQRLKLDKITAVAIMFVAAYSGYATSMLAATNIQTAQKLANLPLLSGFGFRMAVWVLIMSVTLAYIMYYVHLIQKRPELGLFDYEHVSEQELEHTFGVRQALVLIIMAGGFALYVWGALNFKWGIVKMLNVFLLTGIGCGLAAGMSINEITLAFLKGCKNMSFAAVLMGLAKAISLLLSDGHILHSIIYFLAQPLSAVSTEWAAILMFYVNTIINFFVSSGSGQAMVVMPILAPLADLVGVTRQMAVCAFQFGDGLSNIIFPTNGTMMACIVAAGIPFERWFRWALPLFVIWTVLCTGIMALGVMLGI